MMYFGKFCQKLICSHYFRIQINFAQIPGQRTQNKSTLQDRVKIKNNPDRSGIGSHNFDFSRTSFVDAPKWSFFRVKIL